MSATNLTLDERLRFDAAERWEITSTVPRHCTASLCEHGIGAVGELWGIVLPGPVELVPGKTIAECIAERYPEGVEVLW